MFTLKEQTYINQTFGLPDIIAYAQTSGITLDKTDKTQVREILKYRHDVLGSIRKRGHELMFSIFHKLGYDNDGITTIAEAKAERMKVQQLERNELMAARDKAVIRLDEEIAKLTQLRDKLKDKNLRLEKVPAEDKERLQKEMDEKLKAREKQAITDEINEIDLAIQNMNVKELRELAKKNDLSGYYRLRKDELVEYLHQELN